MATLYGIPGCPHTVVAALMLEQQRVRYRRIDLIHGLHRFLVRRVLGFSGDTVPALVLEHRKLQQTRTISRELELIPARAEAAEEWAELELRRLKRHLLRHPPGPLDATLHEIDALLANGVLGGVKPNSADLHAAVLVRLIECFQRVERRPAQALADRLCPRSRYPGRLSPVLRSGGAHARPRPAPHAASGARVHAPGPTYRDDQGS